MKMNEKGSVTMVVIVTIFFMIILLSSFFIYTSSRRRAQIKETEEISNAYDGNMNEIYKNIVGESNGVSVFYKGLGKIDVIWLDKENNVIENPLSPAMSLNGMTPIKWNGRDEVITTIDDPDWYNYVSATSTEDNLNSHWANAKDGENYFVWIPRYAYRITYLDDYKTTPTGYCDGRGIVDSKGNQKYPLDEGIETVRYNGESYIVHPAFMNNTSNNFENGGWDRDLPGIWVGKYETSGTNGNLKIVPNADALNATIGESYTYSKNYKSNAESHLMKNSEWGAVAYLAYSQYGRNGHELYINNSYTITGNSGGSVNASKNDNNYSFNTPEGQKSSSTGNIYGIYDLSGGCTEYVARFNSTDPGGYHQQYGSSFALATSSDKYATRYIINNLEDNIYQIGKIGDATKEVFFRGSDGSEISSIGYFWYADYCEIYYGYPFFIRGGLYSDENSAGIFSLRSYVRS